MVKIKEISNAMLKEYLQAYQELLKAEPHSKELKFKVEAINKAIHNRELLGINIESGNNTPPLEKIKGLFSRKK